MTMISNCWPHKGHWRLIFPHSSKWRELLVCAVRPLKIQKTQPSNKLTQESGVWKMIVIWTTLPRLRSVFHSCVAWRSVSPKFTELCMEMSCHWVLLFKRKVITLELQHIEINTSSRARTVQLAKTYAMGHLTIASYCNLVRKTFPRTWHSQSCSTWKVYAQRYTEQDSTQLAQVSVHRSFWGALGRIAENKVHLRDDTIKVDGFLPHTNTILEFYSGDWHR